MTARTRSHRRALASSAKLLTLARSGSAAWDVFALVRPMAARRSSPDTEYQGRTRKIFGLRTSKSGSLFLPPEFVPTLRMMSQVASTMLLHCTAQANPKAQKAIKGKRTARHTVKEHVKRQAAHVMPTRVQTLQTYARSDASVTTLCKRERLFFPSNGARTLLLQFVATPSSDACRRSHHPHAFCRQACTG